MFMMNVKKTVTHELEKCYSIAPIVYKGKNRMLVAAEKVNKCMMFEADGTYVETIWEQPGGTMTMVQVPGKDGQFLATHKFYSPNDSKEAKIVVVTPQENGEWKVETLLDLPHVHRFDIITRNGIHYLIACALCSGRDFKDDWSHKGKVYACELPSDLSVYNENNQLEMEVVKDELLKNHGYFRGQKDGYDYGVVGAEEGVFEFVPPAQKGGKFEVKQLLDTPASDMALCDFDGDGELEMVVFAPFHGAQLDVYKLESGAYKKVYSYDQTFDFSHAIWAGEVNGKNVALLGHREGKKRFVCLSYEAGTYNVQVLDENVGPANTYCYKENEKTYIITTNREFNEIAWYEVE